MIKKIFPFVLGFMIIFSPYLVSAAFTNGFSGLVPNCNTGELAKDANGQFTGSYENACDFNALMAMINKVIDFVLITLATPVFALILIYVAWLYLSDMGSSENVKKSKHILKNAMIGYVIALAAWLIINTILKTLGFKGDSFLG